MRFALAVLASLSLLWIEPRASAQTEEEAIVTREEPDVTRLDVERLPPEAITVTRDLYAHGFFLEGRIGGIGFLHGIGDYASPGLWASIAFGYEILDWLHVSIAGEGSLHDTNAPPPPARTGFELLFGTASLRLQANFTEAFAMWLAPQFSIVAAMSDILDLYGFQGSNEVGIAYGGELGIDWHFRARHHSIGLSGGVRHFPSFEAPDASLPTLGIHGSAYLRYVF